jgi:tripartite-type tricarboxylate transporter receptor subunit TctC
MKEAGVPGIEGGLWVGLFVPAHTPAPIVAYLNKESNDIFMIPEVRQSFDHEGVTFTPNTPEEFARFLASERQRWSDVIERAHIKFQN